MFDFAEFYDFLRDLRIQTKEFGLISLGENLLGTQRYLFDEIQKGLAEGVHEFYVLKARQEGISTALLAWDMYYVFKYGGTPGVIVTHDEPAREQFRAYLELYLAGLPNEWQQGVVQHNRNQVLFENRSMLQYKVAGLQESSRQVLGRSSAVSFAHCTEISSWGDPAQIDSLKASMAERNPLRFFIWESTAKGFNHWYDMWNTALGAGSIRPIFIGWWRQDNYRLKKGSRLYQKYWGREKMSRQEAEWCDRVHAEYDFELSDEQLAWYRWMRAEKIQDEGRLAAEYPTLAEEAFVATGSKYFSGYALTQSYRRIIKEPRCQSARLQFGPEFTDTEFLDVKEPLAHLRVYEDPIEKGAWYAIGADPAYGSSDKADRFCAQVLRCYANRIEQVAEYCTVEMSPYTFAWVIIYLAGAYRPCVYNIELNGSGTAVMQEIDNVRRSANRGLVRIEGGFRPGPNPLLRDVTRRMSEFLSVREDSISGRPQGKHTLTTERTKETYMALMKDNFERGTLVLHSRYLLDEMKTVIRDEGRIEAQSDAHDDRVIACALAVKAWQDQVRSNMINRNIVWIPPEERDKHPDSNSNDPLPRLVRDYMKQAGIIQVPKPQTGFRAYNLPRK